MRYSQRRNNRPQMQAYLEAQKKRARQEPSKDGETAQPVLSSGSAISKSLQPAAGRNAPAIARPGLHSSVTRRLPGSSRPIGLDVVEGTLEQEYDPAQSAAPKWGMLMVGIILLGWGIGLVAGFQVGLSVLFAIGLLLSVVGLLSPGLGVLAIGMVAALDAMANIFLLTGGILRYNTLNYLLIVVMLLYITFILRLRDFNSRALQIFIVLLGLELTFSSDISRGIQDILNIGVTFGMVVYLARGLEDELSLYWLGIVNGLLAALGGLVFFLQMASLPYANPNDWTYFQMTALFSICISYPFAIKYHKNRIILLILAAINLGWIFLSGSRGSLAVGLLSIAYIFLSTRSITWKTVMVVIALLVGLWFSANFAEQQIATVGRIQLLFDPTASTTKKTSKRSVIAEAGLRIFEKNPMGIGTGSFAEESITTGLLASQRPAHSAWIKVLAENGVLGIALMVVFIGSFVLVGFHKHQQGMLLLALFIAITLAGAFVAKEFRGKSLWFLVAAGIVMLHREEMLVYLRRKMKINDVDYRRKLREVRFGRK